MVCLYCCIISVFIKKLTDFCPFYLLCTTVQLAEDYDFVWDDGVAPELALDFDAPNVSSREALWTLIGVLGAVFVFHQTFIHWATPENPALNHATDCKIPDWSMGETEIKKEKE